MKKRKGLVFALSALCLLTVPLSLQACGGSDNTDNPDGPEVPAGPVTNFAVRLKSTGKNIAGTVEAYVNEEDELLPQVLTPGNADPESWDYDTDDPSIVDVSKWGNLVFKKEGTTDVLVTCKNSDDGSGKKITKAITIHVNPSRIYSGVANYAADSYSDKLEILGKLEKYAIDNHLTGLTLFEDGGTSIYSKRIDFPTQNYITGYGFGIQSDGSLTGNLPGINESYYQGHPEWASYYQSAASTGIKNICYMDDQGSVTSDLYSYISAGLYGTQLNESKTGYVWVGNLAKSDPIPCVVDEKNDWVRDYTAEEIENSSGLFTSFKIQVKTGKDGVKYSTLSKNATTASYNNRDVALEDYITGYRNIITKRNNYYRGAEMVSLTSSGTLKGSLSYYNATGQGTNASDDASKFAKQVGLKAMTDEGGNEYLVFTLTSPLSIFYAKYNLGGNMTMPVPQDFLNWITPAAYAKGKDKDCDVMDSILSLGAYNIEVFDTANGEFVFKKNDNYQAIEPGKYLGIPGVHMRSYDSGSNADIFVDEFKAGRLDGCSLTKNTLHDDFSAIGVKKIREGTSTFKLNINSCTSDEWEELFGENGSIYQNAKTSYWKVKPFMSNESFLKGLSFCINREEYANNRGVNPSQDYFSPAYMWDPEGTETSKPDAAEKNASYSNTQVHKDNLKDYYPETYGYNVEAAKLYFRSAINEMVSKGEIKLPYNEELHIAWMNTGDEKEYGIDLKNYIEDVVNSVNQRFHITVVNDDGTSDYQIVYNKMRQGQFDLGFGSISGMNLDPLGFLEVLKSDNSSGFTLNWGSDTSKPSGEIIYQDKAWSFDGLWTAATKGAIIDNSGKVETSPIKVDTTSVRKERSEYFTTYTLLVEQIDAAGAEIALKDQGNVLVISFKDPSDTTGATTSTYAITFDDMEDAYGHVIEDGFTHVDATGPDSTKIYKKIIFKVPNTINATLVDESTRILDVTNDMSLELTCTYDLTITTSKGPIATNSSYTIEL